MPILHFSSPAALAEAAERAEGRTYDYARGAAAVAKRGPADHWTDGETFDSAAHTARTGDNALVPAARAMLDKITPGLEIDRPEWVSSPMGAYPMVPDALAGSPACMRRMVHVATDRSPVRIYASVNASANLSAAQLTKRGTAILALAMLLEQQRPVELYALGASDGNNRATRADGLDAGASLITVKLPMQPIDLSAVAYALTSSGFNRHLRFAVAETVGFTGRFAFGGGRDFGNAQSPAWQRVRRCLDLRDCDFVVPAAVSGDDDLFQDPAGWVQRRLDQFNARD